MPIENSCEQRELHHWLRLVIRTPGLDQRLRRQPELREDLVDHAERAGALAWSDEGERRDPQRVRRAQLDTQRALYELNRLRLCWLDDPDAYLNERSRILYEVEELLQAPWQRWVTRHVPTEGLREGDPGAVLRAWVERDLTSSGRDEDWFLEHANLTGYRKLLKIASLNGLMEASQLSRVMGGPSHPVQSVLFRILMEEYGAGRPHKKHSAFFARMLEESGLCAEPEAYLAHVPWQVLSAINHSFYLTENRRHYLRFCGAFTYTELSTPLGFRGYAAAAKRLGLSDGRSDYWALHVREDERHGAWMVTEVALPLIKGFPDHAHEVLFGYAQQRLVESMAGAATEAACREAQRGGSSS